MSPVVICSRVSRASSTTSVGKAEVVRVVIGSGTTAHSVPTGIHQQPWENRITGKTQSSRKKGTIPVTESTTKEPDTDEEQKEDFGIWV